MKYSRTFACPKCLHTHKVESDRKDLDKKQQLRIDKCMGREVKK